MGVIGKSEKDAALTTWKEYRYLLEGQERRSRTMWEVARWEQYHQMMLSPNIKSGNKPRSLHAFSPFPWDKVEQNELTAQEIAITDAERTAFIRIIKDIQAKRHTS